MSCRRATRSVSGCSGRPWSRWPRQTARRHRRTAPATRWTPRPDSSTVEVREITFGHRVERVERVWQRAAAMSAIRITVAGASGRMGRTLLRALTEAADLKLAFALERPGHGDLGRDAGTISGLP